MDHCAGNPSHHGLRGVLMVSEEGGEDAEGLHQQTIVLGSTRHYFQVSVEHSGKIG